MSDTPRGDSGHYVDERDDNIRQINGDFDDALVARIERVRADLGAMHGLTAAMNRTPGRYHVPAEDVLRLASVLEDLLQDVLERLRYAADVETNDG